jgi:hypothetical protein
VVGFTNPKIVLRAGQGYAVTASGLVDFAGQTEPTSPPLRLAAFPAADVASEDGFESTTGAELGGAMVVTTGGPLPAIAGNTSLYIGNKGAPGLDSSSGRTLTVRLARQAGDTRLRFSYRLVAATAQMSYGGVARVGVEGGSPGPAGAASFGNAQGAREAISVAGKPAYAGPLSVLELELPADASDQVLFTVGSISSAFCGPPRFDSGGLLIDDLRLE